MLNGKSFITGHQGFLGKSFIERVKPNAYLYNRNGLLSTLKSYNPEYIFHFAAEIYNEEDMFESNILLTYNLLEEARKLPNLKAFIYVGSSSEYGLKLKPMKETNYLDPSNMYEATKGAGTLLCQAYARNYNLPIVIARPFSLYGKYEPKHRFIPTIINCVRNKRTLNISPGVHDFIHINDFIDGLIMLTLKPQKGEIYNFGTGVQTSNKELVELVESVMRKQTNKNFIEKLHTYDSDSWVADISKAKKLGWKPKYNLEKGLVEVIQSTVFKSIFSHKGM